MKAMYGVRVFCATLMALILVLASPATFAQCSVDKGKVTINEYNTTENNNFVGKFVEIKLLDTSINVTNWTLETWDKNSKLDGKKVSAASVGNCTGTVYRTTEIGLNSAVEGKVYLFDAAGKLADVLYVNQALPATDKSCTLSEIPYDKDIQGAGSNNKNISRKPDGTGTWKSSNGNGANSEQTICANNEKNFDLTYTASKSNVKVGETVVFTVTVKNVSTTTQTSVDIESTLTNGFAFLSSTQPGGVTFNSTTNKWTIASIAAGTTYTMTITATARLVSPTTGDWTSSVVAKIPATGHVSDTASAKVTVDAVQLVLSKTVSPAVIAYSSPSTFTVTVRNASAYAYPTSFAVTDAIPAGLVAGTPTASAGSSFAGSTWTINSGMAAGATYTLTLPVTSGTTSGAFINTATATTPFGGATQTATATLTVMGTFNAFESSTAASAVSGSIYTKLTNTAFSLDVVARTSAQTKDSAFTGDVKVELLAAATGATLDSNGCPTTGTVIQTKNPVTVTSGRSTVNFDAVTSAYRDVRVRITYTGATPAVVSCSGDNFAIRPQQFTVTTPALTNATLSGSPSAVAGTAFTLAATANVMGGYNGTPTLNTANVLDHLGAAIAPSTLSGTFSAATGAAATGTAFKYLDVGSLQFAAGSVVDSGFTSVDSTTDCVANSYANVADASGKYGCLIGNIASSKIGRWTPSHYSFSGSLSAACTAGGFSYMDNDALGVALTIKAHAAGAGASSASDPVVSRYTTGYTNLVQVTISGDNNGAAVALTRLTSPAFPAMPDAGLWNAGQWTVNDTYKFSKLSSPDGAFDLFKLKAAIANDPTKDADPVSLLGTETGTTRIRYGRARMANAYGSELLDLPVVFQTEYYDGGWKRNTLDVCTNPTIAIVNTGATNIASSTCVLEPGSNSGSGCGVALSGSQTNRRYLETGVTGTDSGGVAGFAGNFNLWLKAAGSGNQGSVNITADVPDWLKFPWTSTTVTNPTARATFGIYKSPIIYRRENY